MNLDHRSMWVAAGLIVIMTTVQCARSPEVEDVSGIAGAAVTIDGWRMDYEPEIYVGDTLFELINGGADVYHRFGFVQALATQYSDSEKTGGSGEPLVIGDEALSEDYYLNFRSGRFLVTITGFDSEEQTTDGILELARAVAEELGGAR